MPLFNSYLKQKPGVTLSSDILGTANQITVTDNGDDTVTLSLPQDYDTAADPTLAGLNITGCADLALNSAVFQPTTDSTTFLQVKDEDGNVITTCDTVNKRFGVGPSLPKRLLSVIAGVETAFLQITNSSVGVTASNGLELAMDTGGTAYIINREANHLKLSTAGNGIIYFNAASGQTAFQRGGLTGAFYNVDTVAKQMLLGIAKSNCGNHWILTSSLWQGQDHDHPEQDDPTFYFHSQVNPNLSNNQWGSVHHNQANFIITTGANVGLGAAPTTIPNSIVLAPQGSEVFEFSTLGLEITSSAPDLILSNSTHADTAGSGATRWIGKRQDSDGTEYESGEIEWSHDQTAKDQLSKMVVSVNTGAGLVTALEIDSTLLAKFSGAIASNTSTFLTAGPTDNVDVSGINTLFIDAGSNPVTIGGFTGGVDGQVLRIVRIEASANAVTLEHNEGGGSQDIYLHAGADEALASEFGGWTLICRGGTGWYDCSHA